MLPIFADAGASADACGRLFVIMGSVSSHATRILISLYLVEIALGVTLVGIYKSPAYDWSLASTRGGVVLVAGVIGLLVSMVFLVRLTRAAGPSSRRAFAFGLTANVASAALAVLLAEGTVRRFARTADDGIRVGSVILRPTWSEVVAQSTSALSEANASGRQPYFAFDPQLGWIVGPNRRTSDGLYFSSVEGIRSAGPDVRMSDRVARLRVALIGDSNAFSLEVPFEESWGYHLERLLGDDIQVLNFGVDGYGIDQIYLRYERDVRPWDPDVVLIGIVGHDFVRTMAVYPFVSFGWPGYIVKPRFEVGNEELALVNAPLPTPEEILSASRVQSLPFVDYDVGYRTSDWSWRFEYAPFTLRLLMSMFPRWPEVDSRVSDDTSAELNARLLEQLVDSIERSGSVPLTVLLSSAEDPLTRETLARTDLELVDVWECLSDLPVDRQRVPSGHHYTGLANQAIARCTAPAVESALAKPDRS